MEQLKQETRDLLHVPLHALRLTVVVIVLSGVVFLLAFFASVNLRFPVRLSMSHRE